METFKFIFSTKSQESYIHVSPTDLYATEKGYGFVIEKNKQTEELLQIPELNAAFDPWYWLHTQALSCLNQSPDGIYVTHSETCPLKDWTIPLHFKVKVSNSGNYTISIRLKNLGPDASPVSIFTGRRRLTSFIDHLSSGMEAIRTFTVNISDIIPRGQTLAYKDNTLDVVLISESPIALCELTLAYTPMLPTLYILGDSTVTDQNTSYPYHPSCSYAGWGQMLSMYLKPGICISNHAHSGLTTESFRSEGHYDIVFNLLKSGDFVFIQFAHNDQKLPHLAAFGGYTDRLLTYIYEIRQKGAHPVLVTPLARNTWRADGSYNDLLTDYAKACLNLSNMEQVPLIDLHKCSRYFIESHGLEASKAFFFPNDYTHTNDYGAVHMAAFIATAFTSIETLAPFISNIPTNEASSFCQTLNTFSLPVPPDNYIDPSGQNHSISFIDLDNCENKKTIMYLASKGIFSNRETIFRANDYITRVEILEWIIKAVGFVPMNVYNDYYQDVIGHEWYAGIVEVAHQNAIVDSYLTSNALFHPLKEITGEELISFLINSYQCRKQLRLNLNTTVSIPSSLSSFATLAFQSALELGLIDTSFEPQSKVTREHAASSINLFIKLL